MAPHNPSSRDAESLDAPSFDADPVPVDPVDVVALGADAPPGGATRARPGARLASPLARRVVLRAGAALPVGLGLSSLAACGNDEGGATGAASQDNSTQDNTTQDNGTQEADGEGSEDGADAETESQGGTQADGSGFPTQDVPVGGATYDEPSNTVYSQPSSGEFRAFDATCPHQGCAVSEFQDGSLLCPCHGSMFDPTTGDVVRGPAPTGLTPREVTVEGEDLVVS